MKIKELFPGSRTLEIDPATSSSDLVTTWYPKIQATRFNFVVSADSNVSSTSEEATNSIDRFFLKAIRSVSDVIITTGQTARAEQLHSSRFAPLAILTSHPNDLEIPATSIHSLQSVIICSATQLTREYLNSDIKFLLLDSSDTVTAVKQIIQELQSISPLLEVGTFTATQLASAHLMDEVCLSVTGTKSEAQATKLAKDFLDSINVRGKLIQLLESENTYLFKYLALR